MVPAVSAAIFEPPSCSLVSLVPKARSTTGGPAAIQRILERLRLAREGDYFELLGLARDAARSEIRQAHAELISTFADDALEPESRTRHARELRELRAAIERVGE